MEKGLGTLRLIERGLTANRHGQDQRKKRYSINTVPVGYKMAAKARPGSGDDLQLRHEDSELEEPNIRYS